MVVLLLLLAVLIHLFSYNSSRVEYQYSTRIYPVLAKVLRSLTGALPFSIGDIVYGLFIIWLGFIIVKLIRNKQFRKSIWLNLAIFFVSIYIIFNLAWGINYNRCGIAHQLGLRIEKYSKEDLKELNCDLIDKVNKSRASARSGQVSDKEIFDRTKKAFDAAAIKYPFLKYQKTAIKSSLWGWFGNYAGFTGYYNPFTGEAQVNTTIPQFIVPFTTCHEVAHQVGYAKEMEANFVGYIAATASSDSFFFYSTYLDLFLYANKNLYYSDSITSRLYRKELSPGVEKDIQEWITFNRRHKILPPNIIDNCQVDRHSGNNIERKGDSERHRHIQAWIRFGN